MELFHIVGSSSTMWNTLLGKKHRSILRGRIGLSADERATFGRCQLSPRLLTVGAMQVVYRHTLEPLRIFCAECEHSEFIHGDIEARRCLYSECGCSGYKIRVEDVDTLLAS